MRAAIVHRYGPPEHVTVAELPRPAPRAGQILVRVAAAAVTAGDARIRGARFPHGFGALARLALGFRGPRRRVLGVAFSGVVEEADRSSRFAPGTAVSGMTGARMGAHAEFVSVAPDRVAEKPAGVSHEDAAAALFGGTTALHFLRDRAAVQEGQRVLVNGASGSVGSAAVQLARECGARVTAVTSTPNLALATRLGAEETIDYGRTPLDAHAATVASAPDRAYDIVFDAVGNVSRALGLRLLRPDGALILTVASLGTTVSARGNVHAGTAPERPADFAFLLRLVARGAFDPLTTPFGELESLPDAHRLIDSGRKVGNLVVRPSAAG
ncbi:NAD(P)-dependent alcohol dehydrogenase [Leucobacter zeae]|nr:NAD(P)-dependent alcohol dehydrogenase [Leucobacter zeae]